jgi:hypothetical protein
MCLRNVWKKDKKLLHGKICITQRTQSCHSVAYDSKFLYVCTNGCTRAIPTSHQGDGSAEGGLHFVAHEV